MTAPTPDDDRLSGFDIELASALEDFGRQVRPHEFDAHAILRRTRRRHSARVLTASAAGLAVIAGAAAFAAEARIGATPPGTPAANMTRSSTSGAADPLIAPGTFRSVPDGGTTSGFTELGATNQVSYSTVVGESGVAAESIETAWTVNGVSVQGQVSWFQDNDPETIGGKVLPGTVVGTVNGRPAYLRDMPQRELDFWTGARGWATAIIFANGQTETSAAAAELLSVAESVDTTPTAVPMPIRLSGLTGAQVTNADMGYLNGDDTPWASELRLTYDGRSYDITAVPGAAATPTPTGTETTTGLVTAAENVDGLGITVTTSSGTEGAANAPTAAQIMAHVTGLGISPSGWTTDVITK